MINVEVWFFFKGLLIFQQLASLNYNLAFYLFKSLEVRLQYEVEDIITPEPEIIPPFPDASSQLPSLKSLSGSTNTVACEGTMKDSIPCLR